MKVTTKSQLLLAIILISIVVYSSIALICWYLFDRELIAPLIASGVVGALFQYNARKKFLSNNE